jgi:hypothetical protein
VTDFKRKYNLYLTSDTMDCLHFAWNNLLQKCFQGRDAESNAKKLVDAIKGVIISRSSGYCNV